MTGQFVYFIQADADGPIKIGFTSEDPKRRLAQLQTGNASALRLLGSINAPISHEKEFHAELAEWRLQGEWFEPHPTVLATIGDALASAEQSKDHLVHCAFCFKSNLDVEGVMIRGPAANICDDCVIRCQGVIAEQRAQKGAQQ